MTSDVAGVLARGRDKRVYSAAAWSVGTPSGPLSRGLLGTRSWNGQPVTEDALFDLASVTKPIVGLAVLAMVDKGLLALDDPIARYLPDYAGTGKAAITVRHLLTHTSGLPGATPLYREHPTRATLLDAIRTGPLRTVPGTRVEYSSQGFIVLGLVAEAAATASLDTLVADMVTRPAGMTNTLYTPVAADRAVATEDCPWRGEVVCGQVHDENAVVLGGICGHAGLFGTLADLETLGRILAGGGAELLTERTFTDMITCHTTGLNLRRTLAWQGQDNPGSPVGPSLSPLSYGHSGFTGTSLWIEPDRARYYVLLTNRVHPSRASDAIVHVRQEFHTHAVTVRSPVSPTESPDPTSSAS